jgi:DMSO/TMAO reductase YedYZ molybdopterin-dependent catalytic subunit
MNLEESRDTPQPEDSFPENAKSGQEVAVLQALESAEEAPSAPPRVEPSEAGEVAEELKVSPDVAKAPVLSDVEGPGAATGGKPQPDLDEEQLPTAHREPEPAGSTSSVAAEPASAFKAQSLLREQPPQLIAVSPNVLRHRTRRDLLLFGAGAIAAAAGGGLLLPQPTLKRMGIIRESAVRPREEWLLNRALRFDDDVAEALYSKDRLVPTYTRSEITPLRNNYNGATPDPGYIPDWRLSLDGLASGLSVSLSIRNLLASFQLHEQITRLVCVEGWSAIAWWAGLRFDDLLRAYPPMSQAQWVRIESSVNLGPWGNPDPYYVSLDLKTARHPQTLLATHLNGKPLTVEHGAPLRLVAPVKLGLKNIKAITRITFTHDEPADYWAKRGYSRYDGI